MANLVSPGVSVTVTDESFYVSAGPGTVPFIMIATQQDKPVSAGSEVINPDTAPGTLQANAGSLYLISSQRELLQTFGSPIFYSEGGAQVNGGPINEYGLLAAYSYLGISNRAYVMRADVDTYELQPSAIPLKVVDVDIPDEFKDSYWVNLDLDGVGSSGGSIMGLSFADGVNGDVAFTAATDYTYFETEADLLANTPDVLGLDKGAVALVGDNANNNLQYYIALVDNATAWQKVDTTDAGWGADKALVVADTAPAIDAGKFNIWIELEMPDQSNELSALNLDVYAFDETTASYVSKEAPAYVDDLSATTGYGGTPAEGDLYTNITDVDALAVLKVYQGGAWVVVDGAKIFYNNSGVAPNIDEVSGLPAGKTPLADSKWHDSSIEKIDILVNDNMGDWVEFQGSIFTWNVAPPIAETPTDPDNTATEGDVWLDISDVVNYPALYVATEVSTSVYKWIPVDNSDSEQIIFGDARPKPYDALDADAPSTAGLQQGVFLFNTRYSGLNVKQWKVNYVDDDGQEIGDRWVSVSGLKLNGAMLAGDPAVKKVVVTAMRDAMADSDDLRSEAIFYNLIATPGYPELIGNMQSLNIDRKEQAFVLGDSPFTLKANGTDIQNWATNAAGAAEDGDDGLVSSGPYIGVYYPGSCLTTNLDGNSVVQPASHIALRTMAYNDQVAYQWFAPAGLQRGSVTNATSVGYVDDEGEFVTTTMGQGLRDVAYVNRINPIAVIPNRGLYVWGQKTLSPVASALDRVNVARLINYIRYQAETGTYPYLFEPNDASTRTNAKGTVDSMLSELVTLRGLYDFLVVCDESNNTPDRIDRNELWIDIAIQPTKSVEFIYIPIRILNTGEDF